MATLDNINGQEYDIEYYNKNTFDLIIEAYDDDDEPISLSGKSLKMQIKKNKSDSAAVVEMVSGTDITIGGDDNNRLTFDKDTILYGKFIVTGEVTT